VTDQQKHKLEQRGRMAYLREDIAQLSRTRDNLLRPLRDRLYRALPPDITKQFDPANAFDCVAAAAELAAVAGVEKQLDEVLGDYNDLANALDLEQIKRREY
jgi:hypothetical protein